jgi:hypothetical protein
MLWWSPGEDPEFDMVGIEFELGWLPPGYPERLGSCDLVWELDG